ncbi:MAG: type II toxin-antitoxin system RelE/ParE family toxin [Flavobacteriales bacterium]
MGTSIGNGCYKIRLSIASKGGGKSGGSRVITHVRVTSERVYLLSIHDKSEKDTLTDKEIKGLLALLPDAKS